MYARWCRSGSGSSGLPFASSTLSLFLVLACVGAYDVAVTFTMSVIIVVSVVRGSVGVVAMVFCGNRCGLCWGTECLFTSLNWRYVPSASCCGPCCCRRLARSCEEWLKYRYPAQGGKSAVCCSQPEWFPLDTWNALLEHRISSAGCRRWGIIAMQVSAASTRSSW